MPPSHAASRAVLLVLVLAVAVAFVLVNLDPATWYRVNAQAQELWYALRSAVQDTSSSGALDRR